MNNKSAPSISVIVAVFNGAKTIQQCIDSVTLQTYPNKELIIIDGGSQDGTADLLKANNEHISHWISEPDRGIYNAFNKGLAKANGEWIFFMGADDYFWDAQVLERISEQLEKLPPMIRVAYGQVMIVSNYGESLFLIGEPWQKVKKRFRQLMSIPHQGTMHRHILFEIHGKFDESFRISGDYELLLRELKANDAFFIHNVIVTAMRTGGVSWVLDNYLLTKRESRRAAKMHGQRLPGLFWLMAMTKACIKLMLRVALGELLMKRALDFVRCVRRLPPFWTKT